MKLLHRSLPCIGLLLLFLSSCSPFRCQPIKLDPYQTALRDCAHHPVDGPNSTNETILEGLTADSPIMSLDQLLSPVSSCDVSQMGPTTWAYVGDVVFELFVRSQMVWPSRRTSELQEQVVSLVRAEHQAKLLQHLIHNFALTPHEHQIIVRGRNSGSVKGNRRKSPAYNDATALEALLGYVYMTDKDRCSVVLSFLLFNLHLEHDKDIN